MLKFNSGLLYLVITLLFSAAGASTKAADFEDLKSKLRFTGLVKLDAIYDTAASAGDPSLARPRAHAAPAAPKGAE